MKKIKRNLYETIQKLLPARETIVITGMRRVGKTTLLWMIFESIKSSNKVYLDLENPLDQKVFEEIDYNNIWANLKSMGLMENEKAYIFLDEIQSMPKIAQVIKYLYDHYSVKFLVTGSSSFYLKNLFPESLSGRKFVLELYPLDFQEFLLFKQHSVPRFESWEEKHDNKNLIRFEKLKTLYQEYLVYGGFPQVVLENDVDIKKRQIQDILKSYFEKDVQIMADFRNVAAFRDLLLLLLQRTGSKLEISKLTSEVGVSRETVYSYLEFLTGTFCIDLVPMYSTNMDRKVSGAKKVYIADNGFLNMFAKVSEGVLLENAVYTNIKSRGPIFYFQKRYGVELDFILPNESLALEVKRTARAQDYNRIMGIASQLNLQNSYIISGTFVDQMGFIPATEL